MTKTAATSYEVRWRKNSDPVDQWSSPITVGADGHVSVPGLERVTDYTFEARAVSACGAKSAWATQTFNLPDVPAGTTTLGGLQGGINTANANTPNVINPQFADGANGWTMQQGWIEFDGHAQYTGYAGAVNNAIYNTRLVSVTLGQQVTVQATLHGFSGAGTCGACVAWFDVNSNWLAFSNRGTAVTGTTGSVVSRVTAPAPANAAYAAAAVDVWSGTSGSFTADDFILTPSLSSVDELPDGTGRFAVVNGAGFKGVSSVDTNNRAGIDFTQSVHVGKSLANIPDDPTSTRYAVSNIDGNRRALIDATQAGHVGAWNLDSRVVDGTNFQRVGSGYADTSGRVVNLWDGTAVRSAVNTWDGSNRARTGLDSSGVLVPNLHPVDNLKDGTFARPLATTLQNGVPLQTAGGKNALPNGSFSSNLNGTPTGVPLSASGSASDGWQIAATIATGHQVYYESSSAGTDVLVRLVGGYVVPANAQAATLIKNIPPVAVIGGAPFAFTVTRSTANNTGALPAGITVLLRTYINWLNGDGSSPGVTILDASGNSVAAGSATATGIVPATAVAAQIILQPAYFNSTGSPITLPAGVPADMRWTSVQFVMASNLDNEVVDGPIYGRPANADLYSSGGVNRVGLRVAGSGQQVGDQLNLNPITFASLRSVLNTSPITYTITSGSPNSTVNFSVGAFTLQAGSVAINYSASSHAIAQANGTTATWYLFFIDPTMAGGSQSLIVTTSPTVSAQYNGSVNIGNATVTVASGGGGSGGGGSGGGGFCVADDMFIAAGRRAGDAEIGDSFDCIDLPTAAGKHVRALQGVTRGVEECVRLITSDGCALVCSVSTPFDLPDGRSTTAPHMLGEHVITDLGTAIVVSLALVGSRPVTRAHLGGVSYAAGADPTRRIYSHNAGTAKP